MDKYRVFETDEFLKKMKKLPHHDAGFIRQKLTEYVYPQITTEPFLGRNIRKLRGYDPPAWRYRIGRFRIFYYIDADQRVVYILSVGLRKDAYK